MAYDEVRDNFSFRGQLGGGCVDLLMRQEGYLAWERGYR